MEEKIEKLKIIYELLLGFSNDFYELFVDSTNNFREQTSKKKIKLGTTFFEITIYFLFRLDLFLVMFSQQDKIREELSMFCVENIVKKFEQELENNNLREIIKDRLGEYRIIVRSHNKDKSKVFFVHLLQLIYKSENSNKVDFRNFEVKPVIITDFSDKITLELNEYGKNRRIMSSLKLCLKHLFQDNNNFMLLTLQEIEERIVDGLDEAMAINLKKIEKIVGKYKPKNKLDPIFKKKAKRPVAPGKKNKHFASSELFICWLKLIGLFSNILNRNITWEKLFYFIVDIEPKVVSKTLDIIKKGNSELEHLMRDITKYLGEEDTPKLSDVIFVFGSKSLARIEVAVNLYKQGLASKIFISGGMPIHKKKCEKSGVIIFKEWAIRHGVPPENIIIYDTTISFANNVRGGLNKMDELGISYKSMILVTEWFAMRQSWAHMMKYVPQDTTLYRVNSTLTPASNFRLDGWWKNEIGIKTIFHKLGQLKLSEILNSL